MDYELYKQLRDAGFPGSDEWEDKGNQMIDSGGYYLVGVHEASLSELIKACGNKFSDLTKLSEIEKSAKSPKKVYGGFDASSTETEEDVYEWEWGKTPEEAVARLWLALKGKQQYDNK